MVWFWIWDEQDGPLLVFKKAGVMDAEGEMHVLVTREDSATVAEIFKDYGVGGKIIVKGG